MMIRMTALLLTAILTMPVMADESPPGEDDSIASHRRASPPGTEVGFAELKDGDIVPLGFDVSFLIEGMGIAPAGTDIENTGHHHLLIDVDELPDPNLPLPKSENFIHFGGGQTETTLILPEGKHTLQLVYADYAHIPHDPVVMSDKITIHVSANAPAVPKDDEEAEQ